MGTIRERGAPAELPEALRKALDPHHPGVIVEYLADRLGCVHGSWWLHFRLVGGRYQFAEAKRGRIGADELEVMARRP